MGSGSGCRTAISHHEILPGETVRWHWTVRAAIVLKAYPDGTEPDIMLAEPGEYLFRVQPTIVEIDGSKAYLPQLEERVVVR